MMSNFHSSEVALAVKLPRLSSCAADVIGIEYDLVYNREDVKNLCTLAGTHIHMYVGGIRKTYHAHNVPYL